MPVSKGWKRKKLASWRKVCDPRSLRTVKSGKAKILVCCPKGKWSRSRCKVGTRAVSIDKPRGRRSFGSADDKPFVAVEVDSRGVVHGRWSATTVTAAMTAADAKAHKAHTITVRGDVTSDGRSWGPGRGRVEAVREHGRWLRY